jgi:hypothetical protein
VDDNHLSREACSDVAVLWPLTGGCASRRFDDPQGVEGGIAFVRARVLLAIPPGGAITAIA